MKFDFINVAYYIGGKKDIDKIHTKRFTMVKLMGGGGPRSTCVPWAPRHGNPALVFHIEVFRKH